MAIFHSKLLVYQRVRPYFVVYPLTIRLFYRHSIWENDQLNPRLSIFGHGDGGTALPWVACA